MLPDKKPTERPSHAEHADNGGHPPLSPADLIRHCDTLCQAGDAIKALHLVLATAAASPDNVPLIEACATVVWKHTGRYDIAVALLKKCVLLDPHNVGTQLFLAEALIARGDVSGGCAVFSRIIAHSPEHRRVATFRLSKALLDSGYPREAFQILAAWLETGEITAGLLNNMAVALIYLNRSAEALPYLENALQAEPDHAGISFTYATALLKSGHYPQGWARYARRSPDIDGRIAPVSSLPRLRHGDAIQGKKIVLYQEQGLGDTLQFIRFLPALQAQGGQITLVVSAQLVRLMTLSFPALPIVQMEDFQITADYDYAAPIPDLPFITGMTSAEDGMMPAPYLRACPTDIERFSTILPKRRPRIGIVWAGERRARIENVALDRRRSMTLAEMAPLFSSVDATLVNLQFGSARSQLAQWHGVPVFDPMDEVHDMADSAAIMENLDLVLSVDTSPAHLAGALRRPVWLLSRQDACWRWGDKGHTTPWYPDMRIFRAPDRSLASVVPEVARALHQWIETGGY